MSFLQEPYVYICQFAWRCMEREHISKDDLLWTLNYPDKKTREQSATSDYVYKFEKNFVGYGIGLRAYIAADTKRWIIKSCWWYKR